MDRSFVSSSVVKCLFLGSRDKVIVAGNAPSTDVQILYGSEELGVDDSFHTVAHYKQPGVCTDFELCGVARLARTYGAIATWDKHNLRASVSLLNLDTQLDEALISLHTADLFTSKFPISSISFSPEMELLAIATEAGIVSVVELSGGKALCTVKADPCGVLKVQFTRTGQLVTIGESVKSQVKFWDLRSAGDNQAVLTLATELPNQSAGNKAGTGCLCLHPVHERLVSGGSDGMVQLWDLRSTTSLAYASHAGSAVTNVLVHPRRLDTVLSAAEDGSVVALDTALAASNNTNSDDSTAKGFYAVSKEAASVASMDCDNGADLYTLLVGSAAGGITRIAI